MPSLPRIRPRRVRSAAPAETDTRPRITEVAGDALTWIHCLRPAYEEAQELANRFGWHPLDVEDVMSRRQRPKIDVYTEEDQSYLFAVLHFPVYDKTIGRLNAGELDVFLGADYLVTFPTVELRPVTLLFRRCYENEELRAQPVRARLRATALRGARRPLRLLLPDPRQDRLQARADRRRHRRRRDPPKDLVRDISQGQAGDHLLPQDHQAAAPDAAPARAGRRAVPAGGARALLRRHRRCERAHLGSARQLQGSGRGARGHERVGDLAPAERHPVRAHDLQRGRPAADVPHRHLRHERRLPRLRQHGRVLGDPRRRSSRSSSAMLGFFRHKRWL